MSQQIEFAEALDAAERLDPDAQAELVVVAQTRHEFAAGQCEPMTPTELVREVILPGCRFE
ncbi:MAG: hypothetical protein AABP62_18765 [Planctomycetota bacterium]